MSFGDPNNPYGQQQNAQPGGQPGYGYPQQPPQGAAPQQGYGYPRRSRAVTASRADPPRCPAV